LPEKEHKTGKKMVVKKDKNSRKIVDVVSKTKSGEKKSLNKKTEEKGIKKGNKKLNAIKNIEDLSIQENKDIDVIENFLLVQDIQIDQNPIPPRVRFRSLIFFVSKRNYFTIISFLFILFFFAGGYIYPATSEDIASNNVMWIGNEGKYDRGLFSQFYASIAFTMGVFLLGYYVNSTFIIFNIKNWNYFSIGILLMFFFGLWRIGELVYNHDNFEGFKSIVLPIALIVLHWASFKPTIPP